MGANFALKTGGKGFAGEDYKNLAVQSVLAAAERVEYIQLGPRSGPWPRCCSLHPSNCLAPVPALPMQCFVRLQAAPTRGISAAVFLEEALHGQEVVRGQPILRD